MTLKYLDVGVTTLNTSCLLAMQASSTSGWLLLNQFGYPDSTRPRNGRSIKMTYAGPLAVHGQDGGIPGKFVLHANYPNPFNPSIKIRYELPRQVNVTLKVFNLLGQEVASLVNEVRSPGKHEVGFRGENLSSGVYFYRLQAGEFAQSRKLVLLR